MGLFKNLFNREPPKACPKCGEAGGWRCVVDEGRPSAVIASRAVNPFSPAPARNPFGQNMTDTMGQRKSKRCYRCENCGYEKRF